MNAFNERMYMFVSLCILRAPHLHSGRKDCLCLLLSFCPFSPVKVLKLGNVSFLFSLKSLFVFSSVSLRAVRCLKGRTSVVFTTVFATVFTTVFTSVVFTVSLFRIKCRRPFM